MSVSPLIHDRPILARLRCHGVAGTLVLGLMVAGPTVSASASDEWQLRRLFEPTEAERRSERQGGVFIYDGLRDTTVQRAIKEEFDRLEYMMFTNTIVTDEAGEPKPDPDSDAWIRQGDGC